MNKITKSHPSKLVQKQLLLALPVSLIIFSAVVLMLLIGFEVVYANQVYPGIYMHDLDLSGMTLEEANVRLADALPYTYEGRLQLTYQDKVWEVRPIDIGYVVDPSTSAKQAFDFGRHGWLLTNLVAKGRAWFNGVQLSPVVFYDERIALDYLQSIAAEINMPVEEASLGLENTQVIVKSGQVGREVDIPGTLSLLMSALTNMESTAIPLIVEESPPAILDVGQQAELARKILSEPLVLLTVPDRGNEVSSWTIAPEELAAMLIIRRVEGEEAENSSYQIAINKNLFGHYLNSLAPSLSVEPVNTRFIFNDDTKLLDVMESAVIGRVLDVSASLDHINDQLLTGAHEISLQFTTLTPVVTDDATGEELGITEEIIKYNTYFHGSDPARVQNIAASAARFHGLLIAPGETFSMAQALGNISLENGYAEAPIIFGGQTIQGIGGGVCQVSTTLFRTVFFTGFPIVERYAHSYRVGYYEQRSDGSRDPNLAGLDATVYVPIVDFKFTNDTEHWLLMETYIIGNYSLQWKFYSTSDGRTVDWNTTGPTNIVPAPDTLYRENPDLEKGVTKKVDYAADGADISVTRTVYKNDRIHFSDSFYTHFQPWQEVIEYGPGTEIPDQGTD